MTQSVSRSSQVMIGSLQPDQTKADRTKASETLPFEDEPKSEVFDRAPSLGSRSLCAPALKSDNGSKSTALDVRAEPSLPSMTAPEMVREPGDCPARTIARGVLSTDLSDPVSDPAVSVEQLRLDPGSTLRVPPQDVDTRYAFWRGSGVASSSVGSEQVEPRDVLFVPRGESVAIRASDELCLWRISTAKHPARADAQGVEIRPYERSQERGQANGEGIWITPVSNRESDPAVSLALARLEPKLKTEGHLLRRRDERYLIVSGRGAVTVGGRQALVEPGDLVRIPKGTSQSIENVGAGDLVFWAIVSPRFVPEDYRAVA